MGKFDLIVIGGGPAGYLAAERAAEGGLSVLLFEKRSLGGVCLNEGCIPTKSLLYSAKIYTNALHGEGYGVIGAEGIKLDHTKAVARKDNVVKTLVSGVGSKMKINGVQVIKEIAAITGKSPDGFAVSAAGEKYTADKVIIAAGSEVIVPPIPGVAEGIRDGYVLTSREILDIPEVPKKLVIVGAGVIGLEMADYFAAAGAEIVIVEMLDKIAGTLDNEISGILKKNLEKKGITFRLGSKVTAVSKEGVSVEKDGASETIPADAVLLCIGRKPSVSGLGLETIGVLTEKGAIVTDKHLQTNIPGVYAAGDVNGKIMLAHTAYREAEVAVNHILGAKDYMRYDAIPSVIYTYPEAASVGETADSAKEKGIDVKVKKVSMNFSGRYIAETESGDGICKVIIDTKANKVIGVQLIGNYASEIILSATVMTESGLPVGTLKEVVFPHPTVGEIIREALFSK